MWATLERLAKVSAQSVAPGVQEPAGVFFVDSDAVLAVPAAHDWLVRANRASCHLLVRSSGGAYADAAEVYPHGGLLGVPRVGYQRTADLARSLLAVETATDPKHPPPWAFEQTSLRIALELREHRFLATEDWLTTPAPFLADDAREDVLRVCLLPPSRFPPARLLFDRRVDFDRSRVVFAHPNLPQKEAKRDKLAEHGFWLWQADQGTCSAFNPPHDDLDAAEHVDPETWYPFGSEPLFADGSKALDTLVRASTNMSLPDLRAIIAMQHDVMQAHQIARGRLELRLHHVRTWLSRYAEATRLPKK
jgi:hypothetical protein